MLIGSVNVSERLGDGMSPVFAFRGDNLSCKRIYTVNWENVSELVKALRGTTSVDDNYFYREMPHQFWFQTLNRQLTCVDVTEVKPAGLPMDYQANVLVNGTTAGSNQQHRTVGSTISGLATSSTLLYDENSVGIGDAAHVVAEYTAASFACLPDTDVDNPITPTGSFSYYEWDRFTEWTVDFSAETITQPMGAYKYASGGAINQQINQAIRIPISSARVTAKIYNLPIIPPACFMFNGAVNDADFSFWLRPVDGTPTKLQTCKQQTLMFLNAKVEDRASADGDRYYNVTLNFSYRAQLAADGTSIYGHNAAPYYNPTTKKVTFEQIAVNTASATTDGSAPFRLRNFGYFWAAKVPPVA